MKLKEAIKQIEDKGIFDKYKETPEMRFAAAAVYLQEVLTKNESLQIGRGAVKYCSLENVLRMSNSVLKSLGFTMSQYFSGNNLITEIIDVFSKNPEKVLKRSFFNMKMVNYNEEMKELLKHSRDVLATCLKHAPENKKPDLIYKGMKQGRSLMHQAGGWITYARRYSIFTVLGVFPDEKAEQSYYNKAEGYSSNNGNTSQSSRINESLKAAEVRSLKNAPPPESFEVGFDSIQEPSAQPVPQPTPQEPTKDRVEPKGVEGKWSSQLKNFANVKGIPQGDIR